MSAEVVQCSSCKALIHPEAVVDCTDCAAESMCRKCLLEHWNSEPAGHDPVLWEDTDWEDDDDEWP